MASLYELTGDRLALMQKLEEMNFDEECIQDTLEAESTGLQEKIESYGYVIRNRYALVESMDVEIDRMQKRADAERKRVKAIEDWLLQNMIACKISKIECAAFSIEARKNPQSVDILDESKIPSAYMRTPHVKIPEAQPDKKLIFDTLKSGVSVDGCAIKRSNKLVIK